MSVLDSLTSNLPAGFTVQAAHVGLNWTMSLVTDEAGMKQAGVAASPHSFSPHARFVHGSYTLSEPAHQIVQLMKSDDESSVAVGLATLNALLQTKELSRADAAEWLSKSCQDKSIAIFGRFPFIEDEIRPFATQLYIFEQEPLAGEYSAQDMPYILPQADIIAITGTTLINHTLDGILEHIPEQSLVVMLGPSTPLSKRLFDFGIDVLFGVCVIDISAAQKSVQAGDRFTKMQGLERVALFR